MISNELSKYLCCDLNGKEFIKILLSLRVRNIIFFTFNKNKMIFGLKIAKNSNLTRNDWEMELHFNWFYLFLNWTKRIFFLVLSKLKLDWSKKEKTLNQIVLNMNSLIKRNYSKIFIKYFWNILFNLEIKLNWSKTISMLSCFLATVKMKIK
jgi:hypothetical protein